MDRRSWRQTRAGPGEHGSLESDDHTSPVEPRPCLLTMTDVSIQDEVERLRAENAALERRVRTRIRLRSSASGFLLVLGCGLAVLSLVAVWLRFTLLDTDRYVDTVAPIAANVGVQNAVAGKLENAIYSRVDFASLAREVLPERADVLAPAIQRGAQSVISDRI